MTQLLAIEDLSVDLRTRSGPLQVLDGIDLAIAPGETVCLVGESGSGKTITALSILRLIDHKGGRIASGSIQFDGSDLALLSQHRMSALRGRHIGIIFQEPMTAFDPLFTIGAQIVEVIHRHTGVGPAKARRQAIALLDKVHIPEPERRIDQLPHELSGGMQQRAMIAMALACQPRLLIADEPTTALDVTIQAQILQLLKELQAETGLSILFITHNLGVAASIADRVVVLYAGRIIEDSPTDALFARPAHPYTRGLLDSVVTGTARTGSRLPAMRGAIPDLAEQPSGCRFHPRCPRASAECALAPPPLEQREAGRVACWHPHVEPWQAPLAAEPAAIGPHVVEAPPPAVLIRATDLHKQYALGRNWLGGKPPTRAVDGVSFTIAEGETFGLVGESGSGKSTLGRLLLHLEKPTAGHVEFAGRDLSILAGKDLRAARRDMQMIFQDPYGSLDPRWTIGALIAEPLAIHDALPPRNGRIGCVIFSSWLGSIRNGTFVSHTSFPVARGSGSRSPARSHSIHASSLPMKPCLHSTFRFVRRSSTCSWTSRSGSA